LPLAPAYPARSHNHSTRYVGDRSGGYPSLLSCINKRGIKSGLGNCQSWQAARSAFSCSGVIITATTVTINGPTTGIITTDTIDLIGGGTIGAGSA